MSMLVPSYLHKFSCVGSTNCLLSCCQQKLFFLNREQYSLAKTTLSSNQKLYPLFKLGFSPLVESNNEDHYAFTRMNPTNNHCWMLSRDGACQLQTEGDDSLKPSYCKQYPSLAFEIGSLRQNFLSPSCPEVSKIFFSDINKIEFEVSDSEPKLTYQKIPLLGSEEKYFLVRDFFANVLQTQEISILQRMMIICFSSENIVKYYQVNNLEKIKETIDSITDLVISGELLEIFEKNVFDESFHALLLVKLLQIRHEKQLGKTSYDDLLLSIVSAFDLADQSISLEERSIHAIPKIREGLQDLEFFLDKHPNFMGNLLLNHWLCYAFPNANKKVSFRNNMNAFLLFFLLQRLTLAAVAMGSANLDDFEAQAAVAIAAFYREWVDDDSPMLYAAATALTDSSLSDISNVLNLLAKINF